MKHFQTSKRKKLRSPTAAPAVVGAVLLVLAALPALADGQEAPVLNLAKEPPRNALVGTSGPEWDGSRGIARFSDIGYERELVPRVVLRLNFAQSYNGDGELSIRDFVQGGVPIRETNLTDISRMVGGAQLGYVQPVAGARLLLLAGPAWTRTSRTRHRFLTDLSFGDTVETERHGISHAATGMLYGAGLEFDVGEGFAWRALFLHNRSARPTINTLAFGGAMKF